MIQIEEVHEMIDHLTSLPDNAFGFDDFVPPTTSVVAKAREIIAWAVSRDLFVVAPAGLSPGGLALGIHQRGEPCSHTVNIDIHEDLSIDVDYLDFTAPNEKKAACERISGWDDAQQDRVCSFVAAISESSRPPIR